MMDECPGELAGSWNWAEDYTAAHEMRPSMTNASDHRELLITRKKLEVRTWLLKITTALLVSTWAANILYVVNQID